MSSSSTTTVDHHNQTNKLKQRSGERIAVVVSQEEERLSNLTNDDLEDEEEQMKRRRLVKKRSQSNLVLLGLFLVIFTALYNCTDVVGFLRLCIRRIGGGGGGDKTSSLFSVWNKQQDDDDGDKTSQRIAANFRETRGKDNHNSGNKEHQQQQHDDSSTPVVVVAGKTTTIDEKLPKLQQKTTTNTRATQLDSLKDQPKKKATVETPQQQQQQQHLKHKKDTRTVKEGSPPTKEDNNKDSTTHITEVSSPSNKNNYGGNGDGPGPKEKCTPWEISLDDWWQEHPTWEPSYENDTHACFRPIENPERIQLLEKAHQLQFNNGCSQDNKPMIRHLFPMGFAATLLFHLNSAFWSAFRENRQFIPGIASKDFKWLYEPSDPKSWAYCDTHDHECLFLPITNCPRPIGGKDENPKKKYQFRELEHNETLLEHNIWLSHYLMRPRQIFRQKVYEYIRDATNNGILPHVSTPCTWIHVRRADAMTETNYKRNYYFLKEYITRGKIDPDNNLLLLTDDQSTIEEATLLYPNYHWHYIERKRHRGPVHNNAHIPSGDQALEILTIMAERKLASTCQKGVYGNSNMAKLFLNAMTVEHQGRGGYQNLTLVQIDRRALRKDRIDPQDFVKQLDKQLDEARKKLKKR